MPRVPQSWKDAGSGEEQLTYPLFDSALSTTSANTTLVLFDTTAAAAGDKETNMETGGQLPASQRFLIKGIGVIYNDLVTSDDENSISEGGFLKLLINDRKRLHVPLQLVGSGGSIVPAGATQDEDHMFQQILWLESYIHLDGGQGFRVEVVTGDTVPTTSTRITVVLMGELVRRAG